MFCGAACRAITAALQPSARLALCCGVILSGACKPTPESSPDTGPGTRTAGESQPGASVVSIPEEFRAPAAAQTPEPPRVILPRVVFATSDFQVTTDIGIQGIRAGEALNFLRQENENYVVEYGGASFTKNKSFFASTYVGPPRPEPTALPATEDVIPEATAATAAPAEPALPDEPPLSGTMPNESPEMLPEQKVVGDLTESIRKLNDQIRATQDELARKSAQASPDATPSARELKKAVREIQKLKEDRDRLSAELTELGKP